LLRQHLLHRSAAAPVPRLTPMTPLDETALRADAVPHLLPIDGPSLSAPRCSPDLRRVTAGLAHNVNNALLGIIANLELSLRETPGGTETHARLGSALHVAERLAERVRRLVAFVVSAVAAPASAVCLRGVIKEAVRHVATTRPDVYVQIVDHDGDGLVQANEPLLHLVVEQIVCNALEAMPDGGTLLLRIREEQHRRCLIVTDTGRGLRPEVRARLFEPFFTTKSFGHLGLGLTLCRSALETMDGALHLTAAEGPGTTATLSLPPADATSQSAVDAHSAANFTA
jgi:signal transduction histidine kinase